jgi:hypothetical protein
MSTEQDAATMGIEADELAALENSVLRGLRKANWNRLGSEATGAQPEAENAPDGSSPPLLADASQS